jgi:glycosyltransferase involved in cell wall biosynthesis
MPVTVDLIWLGQHAEPPLWALGEVRRAAVTPDAVQALIVRDLPDSSANAWLFWASNLPPPDPTVITRCLTSRADVWHAGLLIGTVGLPGMIDFVHPTWMLNRDPDPHIEASSWRISLDACLIRLDALRNLDGLATGFETLTAAALELGHRALTQGLILRHVPELIGVEHREVKSPLIPFADEARFTLYRSGVRWRNWALMRAVPTGYASLHEALTARRISSTSSSEPPLAHVRERGPGGKVTPPGKVAVIIPTLGRYTYLRTVLNQLRTQTVAPTEVIVIDQNPPDQHDPSLAHDFADLPLTLLLQDTPGQCTARNTAIQQTCAEYLLFLDDDVEIPPGLIAAHLANLAVEADASCGRVDEAGAGPLPHEFAIRQISSVFPTNNAMIRRAALARSGLFDTSYDRTFIDDADLGMRLYHSGALMIYDPKISVLHHHAPLGGLRAHRQRVMTYTSSRQRLTHRSLPGVSEMYYAMRYFTPRQLREMLWMRVVGTFMIRGGILRKAAKVLISLALLPDTLIRIAVRRRVAQRWFQRSPCIPALDIPPVD